MYNESTVISWRSLRTELRAKVLKFYTHYEVESQTKILVKSLESNKLL